MSAGRNKKVAEEIKKVVSTLILQGMKDPRISKLSSINHVDVTNDFRFATVYVSCFDPNHDIELTLAGLNSAKGFIRKEIGKRVKLHYTPEPIFKADHSVEHGLHINDILSTLNIKHDEETEELDDATASEDEDE